MSTDITTREQRAELVTLSPEFIETYPALAEDVDITALLEQAMGPGGELNLGNLTRIKVPSAELKSWMVPDDNGEPVPTKMIKGIPAAVIARRSYWESEDVTGTAPDCRSNDLETGIGALGEGSVGNPSGKCADCPMAARGSAGKGTQASKCKEQRVIFLLTGDLLPIMIVIPPGSLPTFNNFGALVFNKRIEGFRRPDGSFSSSLLRLEVELGLEQTTNVKGQDYNRVTFKIVRRLELEEVARVSAYGQWVDGLVKAQEDAITMALSDVDTAPAADVPFDPDGMPVDEVDLTATHRAAGSRGR